MDKDGFLSIICCACKRTFPPRSKQNDRPEVRLFACIHGCGCAEADAIRTSYSVGCHWLLRVYFFNHWLISWTSVMHWAVLRDISTASWVSQDMSKPLSSKNTVAAKKALRLFPAKKGCSLLISFISAAALPSLSAWSSCPNKLRRGVSTQRSKLPFWSTACLKPCLIARYLFSVSISSRVR